MLFWLDTKSFFLFLFFFCFYFQFHETKTFQIQKQQTLPAIHQTAIALVHSIKQPTELASEQRAPIYSTSSSPSFALRFLVCAILHCSLYFSANMNWKTKPQVKPAGVWCLSSVFNARPRKSTEKKKQLLQLKTDGRTNWGRQAVKVEKERYSSWGIC